MGGFFNALFTGSNPTLSSDITGAGNISNFGTTLGEGDLTQSSDFYKDLLSGDPTKIGEILGPQLSNIQKQGQQQIQTAAEFGNRSGGTNAAAQTNIDSQRQNAQQLISQLTGQAASGLTGIGESALGTGLQANAQQAQESQEQLQNQRNSLLSNVIGSAIGAGEDFLTSGLSGLGGGGGGGDAALNAFGGGGDFGFGPEATGSEGGPQLGSDSFWLQ